VLVPGAVATTTVMRTLDVPVSRAVTVLTVVVPLSLIEDGVSLSVTVGVASSSVIVIVALVTVSVPAVPVTSRVSLGSSRVSFVGVRVKDPVPLAVPAAIVMSKPVTAA